MRFRELTVLVISPDPRDVVDVAVGIMSLLRDLRPEAMYEVKVGPFGEEAEEHEEKDPDRG